MANEARQNSSHREGVNIEFGLSLIPVVYFNNMEAL